MCAIDVGGNLVYEDETHRTTNTWLSLKNRKNLTWNFFLAALRLLLHHTYTDKNGSRRRRRRVITPLFPRRPRPPLSLSSAPSSGMGIALILCVSVPLARTFSALLGARLRNFALAFSQPSADLTGRRRPCPHTLRLSLPLALPRGGQQKDNEAQQHHRGAELDGRRHLLSVYSS